MLGPQRPQTRGPREGLLWPAKPCLKTKSSKIYEYIYEKGKKLEKIDQKSCLSHHLAIICLTLCV
jgi:hypothetical protein